MDRNAAAEAEYQLQKILTVEASKRTFALPWLSESDRWKELVFALFTSAVTTQKSTSGRSSIICTILDC